MIYRFIGPAELLARALNQGGGQRVVEPVDLQPFGLGFPLTYVVNLVGELVVDERRVEHVVCAAGQPVLAAGELAVQALGKGFEVILVTNQSTGYVPKSECWPAVARALSQAGLRVPTGWSQAFEFRRCPSCGQINVIKDGEFLCASCDSALPEEWNF